MGVHNPFPIIIIIESTAKTFPFLPTTLRTFKIGFTVAKDDDFQPFTRLTNLESFSIYGGRVRQFVEFLPTSLLYLSVGPGAGIDKTLLSRFTNLQRLQANIGVGEDLFLPSSLTYLEKLYEPTLSCSLSHLTKLESLHITYNDKEPPVDEMFRTPKLKTLVVSGSEVPAKIVPFLPKSITELKLLYNRVISVEELEIEGKAWKANGSAIKKIILGDSVNSQKNLYF